MKEWSIIEESELQRGVRVGVLQSVSNILIIAQRQFIYVLHSVELELLQELRFKIGKVVERNHLHKQRLARYLCEGYTCRVELAHEVRVSDAELHGVVILKDTHPVPTGLEVDLACSHVDANEFVVARNSHLLNPKVHVEI